MKICEIFTPKRADGEESRPRILECALKLFANHGLERTTVRQIAKEANANVSAISYYFGDKNGLYRAVYTETMPCAIDDVDIFKKSEPTLEQVLYVLFGGFIEMCIRDSGLRAAPSREIAGLFGAASKIAVQNRNRHDVWQAEHAKRD